MRQLEEWGWREHTTRDSGPQAPTIAEWVSHEGKHRARPPQSWTSSPHTLPGRAGLRTTSEDTT